LSLKTKKTAVFAENFKIQGTKAPLPLPSNDYAYGPEGSWSKFSLPLWSQLCELYIFKAIFNFHNIESARTELRFATVSGAKKMFVNKQPLYNFNFSNSALKNIWWNGLRKRLLENWR